MYDPIASNPSATDRLLAAVEASPSPSGTWHYTTQGNGLTVTIHAPDGHTAFLQGDDAAFFLKSAAKTHARFTDSDLCRSYADLLD